MENRFDTLAKSLANSVSRREALSRLGGGLAGLLLATVGLGKAWGGSGSGNSQGQNQDCGRICNEAFNPASATTRAKNLRCKQTCEACAENNRGVNCGIASDGTVGCCSGTTPVCCGSVCSGLSSDVNNCGACGHACPTPANAASVSCSSGTCGFTCKAGYGHCSANPADGCETPLNTTSNCGSCGTTCGTGQGCCNGTCTDVTTTSNCGACGNACPTPANSASVFCSSGSCSFTCQSGFHPCNGSCWPNSTCNNPLPPGVNDQGPYHCPSGCLCVGSTEGDNHCIAPTNDNQSFTCSSTTQCQSMFGSSWICVVLPGYQVDHHCQPRDGCTEECLTT